MVFFLCPHVFWRCFLKGVAFVAALVFPPFFTYTRFGPNPKREPRQNFLGFAENQQKPK